MVAARAGLQLVVQTLAQIRELLASRGLSPKKALGQNFLIDHNLIKKLVDASGVGPGSVVLEVGPGTGTLTEELLARGCRVVAGELDDELAELLRERHAGNANFTLVHGDCLASKRAVSPALLEAVGLIGGGGPFALVANLPYGAATPLMLALLTQHPRCTGMWVTVQREVADRFLAKAGEDAYGTVSVVADAAAVGQRIAKLPGECFWPRPDVESAMFGMARRPEPLTPHLGDLADFAQFLFTKRRKQLGAVLGRSVADSIAWPPDIAPTARAENLSTDQFIRLMTAVKPMLRLHDTPGAG